jgi:AcrR family transcriptional regulator
MSKKIESVPARSTFHHGDLRSALMSATVDLLVSKGVEGFSLREAAAAVGVTPSATYKHFADKGDLLAAIAANGFTELAERVEAAMKLARSNSHTTVRKAMAAFEANGLAYVRFATEQPVIFRLMFGPYGAAGKYPVRGTGASGKDPYELLTEALDGLLEAKVISSEKRRGAELTAWASVHGLSDILISGLSCDSSTSIEHAVTHIVVTLVEGWRPERTSS